MMKITVVGGGNIGTQFAVHIAEKGHEVTMFTSNPGVFREHLSIVDKNGIPYMKGIYILRQTIRIELSMAPMS